MYWFRRAIIIAATALLVWAATCSLLLFLTLVLSIVLFPSASSVKGPVERAIWIGVCCLGAIPALFAAGMTIHSTDVKRLRKAKGLCIRCGYNLTGNTSGICPECGQPI